MLRVWRFVAVATFTASAVFILPGAPFLIAACGLYWISEWADQKIAELEEREARR